ncbi:hypothetical protein D3C87_1552170 [compost metagenome]
MPPLQQQTHGIDDISRGKLGELNNGAVHHQPCVGPVHAEHIGESRHGHAHIGPRVVILPDLMQRHPVTPGNVDRHQELGSVEAGAIDDYVELVLSTVHTANALGRDGLDRQTNHADVVAFERRDPSAIVADDALAADRRIRNQHIAQIRPVGKLWLHPGADCLAQLIVARRHRDLGRRVIDIDHHVFEETDTLRHHHGRPIPQAVVGQIGK